MSTTQEFALISLIKLVEMYASYLRVLVIRLNKPEGKV